MDSSNLPSQTDLNSLYGAWNPMSYMQGQQNQDLAAQFRSQVFDANNNTVTKGQLENDQASQMNPLLLNQRKLENTGLGLTNTGKDITNQSSQLDLNSKTDAYSDKQSLLHKQLAREMSDEDITKEGNTYLQAYRSAMLSHQPEEAAKYKTVLDTLVGAVSAKAGDRSQARDLAELQRLTQTNVAGIQGQTSRDVAGINAGAKTDVAGIHANSSVQIAGIKQTLNQKLAQLNGMDQSNPEVARLTAQTRQDLATANAAYANAISLEKLQGGELGRQGIPGAAKATGTPENPIVLK